MENIYEMVMTAAAGKLWSFPGMRRKLVICSFFLLVSLFASAPAFALDPGLPPSSNFNLTAWKITLPDGKDTLEQTLSSGFESPDEFYTDPVTGGMVFKCPNNGLTTGGSTYPRSELREMIRAGNESISTTGLNSNNWVYSSSSLANQQAAGGVDGIMTATLTVDHVGTNGSSSVVGRVIVGQIHGSANEPCRLYYRKLPGNSKGVIYFAHEPNPGFGSEQWYEMIGSRSDSASNPADGIALGETFRYEIKAFSNTLSVTIMRDGKPNVTTNVNMSASGYANDWLYFKAGVYNQNNEGSATNDYAQATFYAVAVNHGPYDSGPPVILTQPVSQTVATGSNVTFTVGAGGKAPLAYQWYFNTNTLLSGQTGTSLTLSNVQPNNAGSYRVVVTNLFGSVTSAVATLTVLPNFSYMYFTNSGITSWICPANVSSVQVECWGGGGAGGSAKRTSPTTQYGGGGAGGAYAKHNSHPVTPGNTYYISVGAGGANSSANNDTTVPGGDSWFNSVSNAPSTIIIAKGGAGGESAVGSNTVTGLGLGGMGTTNGSAGNVMYAGGSGATGSTSGGGGGGSSAGTGSDGTSATSNPGATAPVGGGNGGTGPTSSSVGGNGYTPGGGGGGARSGNTTLYSGGTGAVGQVILTYAPDNAPPSVSLTATAGAGGIVSPASTNVLAGDSAIFVITASNYYRIATLTTNGTAVAGMTFDNGSTTTNFIWRNVQTSGVLTATFTNQVATNAPAPVPYEWLASYGLTNSGATFDQAAADDQDSDGLTAWQEYIAGTDPTNTTSCFKATQNAPNKIGWSPVAGRVYSVYWSTNLMNGFQPLETNIFYPQGSYTNAAPDSRLNHYQIKVRMQ